MSEFNPKEYYSGMSLDNTIEKPPESTPSERIGKTGTVTTQNHGKARKDSQSRQAALSELNELMGW